MSEDYFDRFNDMESGDKPETPIIQPSVDGFKAEESYTQAQSPVTDDGAYQQPDSMDAASENAYAQPQQSSPAENSYAQPQQTSSADSAYAYNQQPASDSRYGSYFQQPAQDMSNPYLGGYNSRPVQATPEPNNASAVYVQPDSGSYNSGSYNSANTYVDSNGYYHRSFTERRPDAQRPAYAVSQQTPAQPARAKKDKSGISKGAVAALLIICILLSGFAGFGGSMIASKLSSNSTEDSAASYDSVSDELVIHKVKVENSTETSDQLVDKDTDEIVTEVADSVVEITTEVVQTNSFYGQYIAQGAGSGVIISSDGYIVTNNHVIEDASNITVTLRSGESYEAKLVGSDADEDIALIKIEATGLTMAIFGDSDTLNVGDKSVIIGNPLGTLGGSVTEGIVSALDRSIVIDGKTMHLMQTDAAINPGNSGGGMFNGQGELVGIVVAKSGGSTSSGSTIDNIGFVIPINNVLNILSDLKQYGYVRGKADTGMSFVDITNPMYSWYYYGSYNAGVYINSVERGSNAATAGFSAGDRVISVDGKSVSSSSDISSIISQHSAGDTIEFEIERSGRTGTLELTLEEYVPDVN